MISSALKSRRGVHIESLYISVDSALRLLNHMGKFVSDQVLPSFRVLVELTRRKMHHVALGERFRPDIRRIGRFTQLHPGKIIPKVLFNSGF